MKAFNISQLIFKKFPKKNAWKEDLIGYRFGSSLKKVSKVITCLDVDEEIVDYAIANGYEMIISHHPFLFGADIEMKKNVQKWFKNNPQNVSVVNKILNNKLIIFSAHTALDGAREGMNYWFLNLYKADSKKWIKGLLAQVGFYKKPQSINKIISISKKYFKADGVRYNCSDNLKVNSVMLAGGSHGIETIEAAKKQKVDLLITGEIKYHDWLYAKKINQNILVVGHFMEHIFNKEMKLFLEAKTNLKIYPWKETNMIKFRK